MRSSYRSWRRVFVQRNIRHKSSSKQDAAKLKSHENVFDICFSKKKKLFTHPSLILSAKRSLYHHLLGPKGNVQQHITV